MQTSAPLKGGRKAARSHAPEACVPALALVFCLLLLQGGCAFAGAAPEAMTGGPLTLGATDNGSEARLPAGGVLVIELEAPGATGYLWGFTSLDRDFLELQKEETAPGGGQEEGRRLTGAPLLKRWYLKALKKGATGVALGLARPWETVAPVKVFRVTVVIE